MWPFHTWLPDAHVEAPTAGSVILAGVLLKLGTYGFYRFNLPMFPKASMDEAFFGRFGVRSVMIFLAIVSIIYGALAAMYFVVKKNGDVKKLVAYSSVSSMGIVMLGLGIILNAAYMLWLYQRMFFGEITNEKNKLLPDLSIREWAYMLPLVIMSLWIGMYPAPFLRYIEKPVNAVVKAIRPDYPMPGEQTAPTTTVTSAPVKVRPQQ